MQNTTMNKKHEQFFNKKLISEEKKAKTRFTLPPPLESAHILD